MPWNMGCTGSSVPDPNVMYGDKKPYEKSMSEDGKLPDKENGHITKYDAEKDSANKEAHKGESNGTVIVDKSAKDQNNRTLKGDLTKRKEAKIERENKLKDRQLKREKKALLMSDKVMEEKEMLSLVSTRSRATSRTGSPRYKASLAAPSSAGSSHGEESTKPGTSKAYPSVALAYKEEGQENTTQTDETKTDASGNEAQKNDALQTDVPEQDASQTDASEKDASPTDASEKDVSPKDAAGSANEETVEQKTPEE